MDEFYQSELDLLLLKEGVELFTRKVMNWVLEGDSPKDIAKKVGVTHADLWRWITEDEDRYKEYQRMLEGTADDIAWESLRIADDSSDENVANKKLRVETRHKLASKWDRQRYGEQTNVKMSGNVSLISLLSSMKDIEEEPELLEHTVIQQLPVKTDGGKSKESC